MVWAEAYRWETMAIGGADGVFLHCVPDRCFFILLSAVCSFGTRPFTGEDRAVHRSCTVVFGVFVENSGPRLGFEYSPPSKKTKKKGSCEHRDR